MDGLTIRHLFSHSSGGWEIKTRVPSGLVSILACRRHLLTVSSWSCPSRASSVCLMPSHEAPVRLHSGPLLWSHFNLVIFVKGFSPNNFHVSKVRAPTYEFGEYAIEPMTPAFMIDSCKVKFGTQKPR